MDGAAPFLWTGFAVASAAAWQARRGPGPGWWRALVTIALALGWALAPLVMDESALPASHPVEGVVVGLMVFCLLGLPAWSLARSLPPRGA